MTDRLDELAQDAAGAGAVAALASIHAANRVFARWLDLANVESGWPGLNEQVVVVGPQAIATALAPGDFRNWDGDKLPEVKLDPTTVQPGDATTVRLWVDPTDEANSDVPSGTYTGSLLREADNFVLVDEIDLYVVGKDRPPAPVVE